MTWPEFNERVGLLARRLLQQNGKFHRLDGIYGLSVGGLFVAQELSKQLGLPIVDHPSETSLIVDDRVETGNTLLPYEHYLTAVLEQNPLARAKASIALETSVTGARFPWEKKQDSDAREIVVRMLEHLSEDPTREGLLETPKRVIKSWDHLFSGYKIEPASVLQTQFIEEGSDGPVLCKDIEMYSTCEHHLLPFFGRAAVGYIPRNGRIVGLSKLARVVEVFSRRLQNQERLTRQVAQALQDALDPLAVGVVMEAEHFCMRARGVQKQSSRMVTSYWLGEYRSDAEARREFWRLIGL
jgi:GTP cyclohydrolase I